NSSIDMGFTPPMLCSSLRDPTFHARSAYIAEPKLDGQRIQVHVAGRRKSQRPHVVWAELPRSVPARRWVRGQNPEGREARRPPRRATDEVRAGHQPEDRQGPRPDDPAVGAGAGG